MWNIINDNADIEQFMALTCALHDSCIKEVHYLSGAHVTETLSMKPINDQRRLRIIIQRQFIDMPTIELEFRGLKYLKLFPNDPNYTCEIHDSSLYKKNDCIYWCDCGELSEAELDNYCSTFVCASELRWRYFANYLGEKAFFQSIL